jgi:glycosyltransferase involved in cell wall biosynthesis
MNILFLDQYSDLGGAQRCLLDLIPAVRERGWKMWAGVPGASPLIPALQAEGAQVEAITCGPYSMGHKSVSDAFRFAAETPRLARQIAGLAKRANADLLYVNGPRLLPAAAHAAARAFGRSPLPVLFHCHSHLPQRYAAWLAGRSLRRAHATLVACCRFAAEPLASYVPPERFHVVYNAASGPACEATDRDAIISYTPAATTLYDRGSNSDSEPLPEGAVSAVAALSRAEESGPRGACTAAGDKVLRIGVIGRIAPEKGQAEFLQAARLLAPALPDAQFTICGDALFSDPASQRYANELRGMASGLPVDFLGWREDVYSVLAGLDLLVVPSLREPATTRVILEAYSASVPVVAFPSGGIPEIVADGETGFLVSPSTPEALAARIRELLVNRPACLKRAADAGHALWRKRFTLDRYRREMTEMITLAAG